MGSTSSPLQKFQDAQKRGIVIGLKDVAGTKPRLDIDQMLLQQPDASNLLILALSELMDPKQTHNIMAFYQLAGIHGLPTELWNGVDIANKDRNNDWPGEGYCQHGLVTFATWHRPYLAIYEQTIYAKMAEIAERYSANIKGRYQEALKDFRLPYWDYYRPRAQKPTRFAGITRPDGQTQFDYDYSIPLIFTNPKVMVRQTSDNKLVPFDNPFYRYMFPSSELGGFDSKDKRNAAMEAVSIGPNTVRYPTSKTDVTGSVTNLNNRLNQVREPSNKRILDMIADYNDYEGFVTDQPTSGTSGSLEGIHGNYHWHIGGGVSGQYAGWMSSVPTAAFDPVFWIHHCQIDRWAAIWQAAHPGKWFTNGQNAAKQGSLPFRNSSGQFWNHNQVRDTTVFGNDYIDARGSANEVKTRFKNLYSWSVRSTQLDQQFKSPPPEMQPLPIQTAQVFQYTQAPLPDLGGAGPALGHAPQVAVHAVSRAVASISETVSHALSDTLGSSESAPVTAAAAAEEASPIDTAPVAPGSNTSGVAFTNMPDDTTEAAPPDVDEGKYLRDWYIDNIVQRHAFNGPFVVYYFIGKFQDDVAVYDEQPTLAGINYVFVSSRQICNNCGIQAENESLLTDTAVITPLLLDYIGNGLEDLTPAKVVPFLIDNLKWRVVSVADGLKDPRTTPGFKLGVSSKLTPRNENESPRYQEFPQIVETIIGRADQPVTS